MVKKIGDSWSLTSDEIAVFLQLVRNGECELANGNRSFERRSYDLLGRQKMGEVAMVHTVDAATAKRLAKAGLVEVAHGVAVITDEGRRAYELDAGGGMPPA